MNLDPRALCALCLTLGACGGPQQGPAEPASYGAPTVAAIAWDGATAIDAAFEDGDDADAAGRFEDVYEVALTAGDLIRIEARSVHVDTTLRVSGPGLDLWNDDAIGTNAGIQLQVPQDAVYVVAVSTYAAGEAGGYALMAVRPDPTAGPFLDPVGHTEGQLDDGRAELWFEAERGQMVDLRVRSTDFDTVAELRGAAGTVWINDDAADADGGRPLDSHIVAVAPTDGWYQLIVTGYADGAAGAFAIDAASRPPVRLAAGVAQPDVGYAGEHAMGRIHGVFVGITEYANDPLYGCADDAERLAEALASRSLLAPGEAIVLTDAEATAANFAAAVQRIAAVAGPDDVVVVFFSGHGGIRPAAPTDQHDIDGTDETLVFVDQELTDNEVADLLLGVEAGTLLVAIDACQSGGFARDLLTRPGVIGVFSSDEDVLSSTAEPLEAGGYLSYFVAEAFAGAADARPEDGALTAGEFTDFLVDGFRDEHLNMNPAGTLEPYQRLVVDRGSVGWGELLWLLPIREGDDCPPMSSAAGVVGGAVCE